jgi:hypothetical protein
MPEMKFDGGTRSFIRHGNFADFVGKPDPFIRRSVCRRVDTAKAVADHAGAQQSTGKGGRVVLNALITSIRILPGQADPRTERGFFPRFAV